MNKIKRIIKLCTIIVLTSVIFSPLIAKADEQGVDLSSYQTVYDYQAVKDSGISAVYLKASEGSSWKDPKMNEFYNGFKNIGSVSVGFYHFFSEWADGDVQAENFYNSIKNYNYDLIPVLDVETNMRGLSSWQLRERILDFTNKFKELSGIDVVIYTGSWFQRSELTSDIINNYKFWIASYGVSSPKVADGTNLVGFQYSESIHVNGISSEGVDGDVFYDGIYMSANAYANKSVPQVSIPQITYDYNNCDMIQREKQFVGNRCLELQQLLNKVMNTNISEDSSYGTQTHNLLGQFQQQYFGSADYLAGNQTFAKLKELVEANSINLTLRDWQQAYNDTYGKHISVDGVWGNESENAMKNTLVKQGQVNSLVGFTQCRVNTTIDDNFGYFTSEKVRQWQNNNSLVSDGQMGYNSFYKMIFG